MYLKRWYRKKTSVHLVLVLVWLVDLLISNVSLADTTFTISEVAPGVFLHQGVHEQMTALNQGDIVNSGFIIGSTAVAVIDPGGSVHNARLLQDAIKARTRLPVRYVVLTHIHPDHVAGASVFPASTEVIAHAHYPRALAQRGTFYFDRFPELYGGDRRKGLRIPDTLVESKLEIDLGERLLLVEAHPTAHTDNDLSVLDLVTRTLFASDLLFAQRTPSLDGSLSGWLKVLQQMQPDEYALVIPGHGAAGSWAMVAEPLIRYLKALKLSVAQRIGQGFTLSETLESDAGKTDSANWQLFDEVHPVNLTKAYTELEWE